VGKQEEEKGEGETTVLGLVVSDGEGVVVVVGTREGEDDGNKDRKEGCDVIGLVVGLVVVVVVGLLVGTTVVGKEVVLAVGVGTAGVIGDDAVGGIVSVTVGD